LQLLQHFQLADAKKEEEKKDEVVVVVPEAPKAETMTTEAPVAEQAPVSTETK